MRSILREFATVLDQDLTTQQNREIASVRNNQRLATR